MKFRFALLASILGFFLPVTSSAKPPNILFIISDDLNNELSCYGSAHVQTPNLDKLAARGVKFNRAYCQFPLCGPSRNSMLTGLYPNSTGIVRNAEIFREFIPDRDSLSQAFRRHGYFAGRIGKLYHYNVPKSVGTNGHDDPGSWELELNPAGCDRLEEERDIFSLRPGSFGGTLSWYASPNPDNRHTDAMLAKDAGWVLERCAKEERPFFLAVGFYRPHTPYVAPAAYFDLYEEKAMPLVNGWKEDQSDIPLPGLGSHKKEHDLLTETLRQQAIQAYFASITFMDAQVGRVIDKLDALGLSENTIVVFTSDHGYHLGEHGLWQKQSVFEESARVPLIISAPGVTHPGSVVEAPVGLIDIYPTLTQLADVKAPEVLHGQDLTQMLADPSQVGRGYALSQVWRLGPKVNGKPTHFNGYSIRTARWRYTEWDEGRRGRELYDHENDPGEQRNLAEDPTAEQTVARLSKQLREVFAATFPATGKRPSKRADTWNPNLTHP